MRWLIGFYLTVSAWAQLAPSTLNFTMRQAGENSYFQSLSVTGSGAVSLGACTNVTGTLCSALQTSTVAACGAQGTLCVFWDGFTNFAFTPGAYQATLLVTRAGGTCSTNCTLTINLTVVAYTIPTFTSPSGSFSGCSNSSANYFDLDTCTITNVRPGGTFNMPTLGNTVTDPQFGGVIRRIGNTNRAMLPDSVTSALNLGGTLASTTDITNGNVYFTNPITAVDTYNPTVAITRAMAWDPRDQNVYYYMSGSNMTIHKVVLPSFTDTVIYTYGGAGTDLTNGGDGGVSKDGYWCGYPEGGDKVLILVNLNTGAGFTYNFTANPTMNLAGFPARLCTVSKGFDSVTHKMYVVLGSYPGGSNEVLSYKLGDAALTDEGPMPLSPHAPNRATPLFKVLPTSTADCIGGSGDCRGAQHMDTIEVNGIQYLIYPTGPNFPTYSYLAFMRFNAGVALMETAVEAGGGMTLAFPYSPGVADMHVNAASLQPVAIMETDSDPQIMAWRITNAVTSGGNINVTVATSFTLNNGDSVLINAVGGCTNLNGIQTVSSASGSGFTVTGNTCNATYTAATGSLVANVTPGTQPHQAELIFYDATNIASRQFTIKRLAKHRSFNIIGDYTGANYYGQSHPTLDPNGTIIAFESNNGTPDNVGAFSMPTGFTPAALPTSVLRGNVLRGAGVIR